MLEFLFVFAACWWLIWCWNFEEKTRQTSVVMTESRLQRVETFVSIVARSEVQKSNANPPGEQLIFLLFEVQNSSMNSAAITAIAAAAAASSIVWHLHNRSISFRWILLNVIYFINGHRFLKVILDFFNHQVQTWNNKKTYPRWLGASLRDSAADLRPPGSWWSMDFPRQLNIRAAPHSPWARLLVFQWTAVGIVILLLHWKRTENRDKRLAISLISGKLFAGLPELAFVACASWAWAFDANFSLSLVWAERLKVSGL